MRRIKTIALILVSVLLAAAFSGCASRDSTVVMKLGGIDVRYDVFRFAVPPNPSTVSGNASDRLKPDATTFVSASVPFAAAVPP